MKLTNTLATIMLAAVIAVGLSACGKKKNSSNNAATPGSACILNPQTGQYYTAGTNTICNPNATQITCPANGIYTNNLGQQMPCTPGQIVNTGGGLGYPGQYQYPGYMNQDGCTYAYYQYGVPYIPVVMGGTLQCLRYDLVNQVSQGTPYYNNYDYWYAYPPDYYQQSGGGFCLGIFGINYCQF